MALGLLSELHGNDPITFTRTHSDPRALNVLCSAEKSQSYFFKPNSPKVAAWTKQIRTPQAVFVNELPCKVGYQTDTSNPTGITKRVFTNK